MSSCLLSLEWWKRWLWTYPELIRNSFVSLNSCPLNQLLHMHESASFFFISIIEYDNLFLLWFPLTFYLYVIMRLSLWYVEHWSNFLLQKLDFKFPLTVSCIHFICSAIGAYLVIKVMKLKPLIVVDPQDRWRRIFPMSFVFCINIVLGNVSLRYIPVSFMQTIKSFTPATTG